MVRRLVLLKEKILITNKRIQVQVSILMKKDLILLVQSMASEELVKMEKEMEILRVFQDLDNMIQQLYFCEDKEMDVRLVKDSRRLNMALIEHLVLAIMTLR